MTVYVCDGVCVFVCMATLYMYVATDCKFCGNVCMACVYGYVCIELRLYVYADSLSLCMLNDGLVCMACVYGYVCIELSMCVVSDCRKSGYVCLS